VLGADRTAVVGERDGALDLVLELAHVAGKRICAQAAERLGRDRRHRSPGALAVSPTLNEAIEQLKRRMIDDALRECGSKTRAAERLGLSRQSLQQMLRRRQA
jgi:transcriptional regulator with PAS, ATPase and Fis domain